MAVDWRGFSWTTSPGTEGFWRPQGCRQGEGAGGLAKSPEESSRGPADHAQEPRHGRLMPRLSLRRQRGPQEAEIMPV